LRTGGVLLPFLLARARRNSVNRTLAARSAHTGSFLTRVRARRRYVYAGAKTGPLIPVNAVHGVGIRPGITLRDTAGDMGVYQY
jgi:hypothetical protein